MYLINMFTKIIYAFTNKYAQYNNVKFNTSSAH